MEVANTAGSAMAVPAEGKLRSAHKRGTPTHQRYASGGAQARFAPIKPKGRGIVLHPAHPAAVEAHTIFPTTVNPVDHPRVIRLLKSGHNSRKIGKTVTKGKWRGFPIFTLTLEERATCPTTCEAWYACYGNGMPYAQRLLHGEAFERRLWDELAAHQAAYPAGFVVRLHVLGDFYSVDYAELWAEALEAYPALHVFGYTARDPRTDPIGAIIAEIAGYRADRFAMRFSGWDGPTNGSVVVDAASDTEHLICPAQTGRAERCASCALCWHSDRTIAFLRH